MHRIASCLILVLLLGACSPEAEGPPLKGAAIGGPFALIDQNGRTVRDTDFIGKYRLVYFGFTYCPDVCPIDLQAIGRGLMLFEKQAPQRASKVQPIFISVDPGRDTPAVLKSFVAAFHPRLIGLTGTTAQIATVAKNYGVYLAPRALPGSSEYLVDHSRQSTLLGPKGEPIVLIPQDEGPEAIAAILDKWIK